MADRYWVGGSGNWNATLTTNWSATSGGASGASAPTSADNVIFDAGSDAGGIFTVTVTGTSAAPANCLNFTAGSLDFALTFTMGATAFLDVYESMTLPASNFSVSGTAGAGIRYKSTATGKTLTTNGVSLGNVAIVFDGVGGGWTLGSAYTSTQSITLTNGAFNTGNFNITATGVLSNNANVRSLTLGSSTLTLNSVNLSWQLQTTTNLTFSAGTSQINNSGFNSAFEGGGLTYYNVAFTSSGGPSSTNIRGANTYNNLTFTTVAGSQIRTIILAANQIVNGTITIGATNTANNRLFLRSDFIGTPRTITAATVATLADVDFCDIVGAGVGTWSGTRLGNCGGNTGITFDASKTVYRVSAGSWGDGNWSLSSGGPTATNNFPLAQDTVIFDTGTITGTHTINTNWNIGTLDMSALNVAVTLATGTTVPTFYGNVTLDADVTLTGAGTFTFFGASTQTFTSVGVVLTQAINVNKPSGVSFVFADNLTSSVVGGGALSLTQGTIDLNVDKIITVYSFNSNNSNPRTFNFGTSGILKLTGNNLIIVQVATKTNMTVLGNSNVELTYAGATGTRTISSGFVDAANLLSFNITGGTDTVTVSANHFVKNLNFNGFAGTFTNTGFRIYGDLIFSSGMTVSAGANVLTLSVLSGTQEITSNGKTLDFPITIDAVGTAKFLDSLTMGATRAFTFSNGTVQLKSSATSTTGAFATSGTTQKYLQSTTPGTQATLTQASGTVNATYLSVKDINATGGATWNALWSSNNVDEGNNSGWVFGDPPIISAVEYTYALRSFTQPRRF